MPEMPPKAAGATHLKHACLGEWSITEMDGWDETYVELDGPAFIRIGRRGEGVLHFGAVDGVIDHRLGEREGRPLVEFSREGFDEEDKLSGRGWAVLEDNRLAGRIYFHQGAESQFTATKGAPVPRRHSPARRTG